ALNVAGGDGTGTGVGGNIAFSIYQASGTPGSSNHTTGSTVLTLNGTNGSALFQNAANSTSAFQVQNANGTSTALDVDTSNNRVGVGTASPNRTLDVAINNSTNSALPLLVEQTSGGDTGVEFKNPAQSYF